MDQHIFEKIKKINEHGQEYWQARELARTLWYVDFSNFAHVIKNAKVACEKSKQPVSDHFSDFTEMVQIWSWAKRGFPSWKLSRYACYLIIQNADPSKKAVALGQTYFALQTRKQEIQQQFLEDQKRVHLRDEVTHHNKKLFSTARWAGVKDYANFYDYGYLGLYGMRKKQIIQKKWLQGKDNILDHMNSEELAANLFRATQAEAKIKREGIRWQEQASKAHYAVGQKIRKTIKELGGTMPEDIPAVENIKHARKRLQEMEHHIEWRKIPLQTIDHYPLPNTIDDLTTLTLILKNYPWNIPLQLGESIYMVSDVGETMIKEFLIHE